MELPACRFEKPLGFTEKQVMGPLLSHKTIPSHEHKSSKHSHTTPCPLTHSNRAPDVRPTTTTIHGSTLENTDEHKHG
jgi:hypothetical protein